MSSELFQTVNLERTYLGDIEVKDSFGRVLGAATPRDIYSDIAVPRGPSLSHGVDASVVPYLGIQSPGPIGSGFDFTPNLP